jgi:hypothetical protein
MINAVVDKGENVFITGTEVVPEPGKVFSWPNCWNCSLPNMALVRWLQQLQRPLLRACSQEE